MGFKKENKKVRKHAFDQEKKKKERKRKHALDKESDQEKTITVKKKRKNTLSIKKATNKKENFLFSILVFFYKFSHQ